MTILRLKNFHNENFLHGSLWDIFGPIGETFLLKFVYPGDCWKGRMETG